MQMINIDLYLVYPVHLAVVYRVFHNRDMNSKVQRHEPLLKTSI